MLLESASDTDRLVKILGFDQKVAAELLSRLGEGAVGDEVLALAHPDAGRRRDGMQRTGNNFLAQLEWS